MQKEESEEGNESPRLSEVLAETLAKMQAEHEAKWATAFEEAIGKNPILDPEAHQRHLEAERSARQGNVSISETVEVKARRLGRQVRRVKRWEEMKPLIRRKITQAQIAVQMKISVETVKRDYRDMRVAGEFPEE